MLSFHNINQSDVLVSLVSLQYEMKRALSSTIVDNSKRAALNIRYYIGKTRDKASVDFGRNPLGAGRA